MPKLKRLLLAGFLTIAPYGLASTADAAVLKVGFSGPAFDGYSYRFADAMPTGIADAWAVRGVPLTSRLLPSFTITFNDVPLTNGGSGFGDMLDLPLSVTVGNAAGVPASITIGDAMTFKVRQPADGGPLVPSSYAILFRTGSYEATIRGGELDGQAGTVTISVFDTPSVVAVPEPAAWTLLIPGFGLVGGSLRTRRSATGSIATSASLGR